MPGPDWMYHPIGIALALAGGLWFFWSLFLSGRAKGKPRCPKCWYDMTGAKGLTCPECGRVAKSPKGLLKTRRRWFQALASLLVLLLAYSAWEVPRIKRYGWPCALPNWALIVMYPFVDPPGGGGFPASLPSPIIEELYERLHRGRMRSVERRTLSFVVGRWISPAAPRYQVAGAIDVLIVSGRANSSEVERLIMVQKDGIDIALRSKALIALGRVAICDQRVQELVSADIAGPNLNPTIFGDPLPRVIETEQEKAAWLGIVSAFLERPTWARAQAASRTIARIGPMASPLVPALVSAVEEGVASGQRTDEIEAAIAVVKGDAASEAEFWSRRFFLPVAADREAAAINIHHAPCMTVETVRNLGRALESETDDRVLASLINSVKSRCSDCATLVPQLRAISERRLPRAPVCWSAFGALDHLEYPW